MSSAATLISLSPAALARPTKCTKRYSRKKMMTGFTKKVSLNVPSFNLVKTSTCTIGLFF